MRASASGMEGYPKLPTRYMETESDSCIAPEMVC